MSLTGNPRILHGMKVEDVTSYFAKDGLLAQRMPNFESRPEQVAMAESVMHSLMDGEHLMVEAGTGTGKSLAYLVPAILWAVANDKKVVVSTYTKTLQEQILNHDIPLLRETLPIPFRYALCLGNENYLSLRRMKRAGQTGLFNRSEEDEQLDDLFSWSRITKTGIKSELPFQPLPSVWEETGRQKDLCQGKNCETYQQCFYFRERRRWYSAHLLVVNHSLFFANVANSGAVLPRFDAVIFDEGQNLEEVGTNFLGLELSNASLNYFLDRLYNPRTKRGRVTHLPDRLTAEIRKQVIKVRQAADAFFENLFDQFGRGDRTLRFHQKPSINNTLFLPLKDLHEMFKSLEPELDVDEDILEATSAAERCFAFNNTLTAWLNQDLENYVYWLEINQRKRFIRATLKGVPVNIKDEMQKQVFDKTERVVMTSATLSTNHTFDYVKERLGFEPEEESILDSPFDYPSQALLYLPKDLPEPSEEINRYVKALSERIEALIESAGGKTFLLFTSYDLLNRVFKVLDPKLSHYPLLKQGDLSPSRMLDRFKQEPSVIFGTNSFWQGVDIPGDALSSVVITKLPFDVPTDPLVQARIEDMKKRQINPFKHFQIPRAIIQLRQGFGRLIRTRSDRGVVSILDSRMVRRGYGQQFIDSLPDCSRTQDINDVKQFLNSPPALTDPRKIK